MTSFKARPICHSAAVSRRESVQPRKCTEPVGFSFSTASRARERKSFSPPSTSKVTARKMPQYKFFEPAKREIRPTEIHEFALSQPNKRQRLSAEPISSQFKARPAPAPQPQPSNTVSTKKMPTVPVPFGLSAQKPKKV